MSRDALTPAEGTPYWTGSGLGTGAWDTAGPSHMRVGSVRLIQAVTRRASSGHTAVV